MPIIALTAHAYEGFRERCLAAGMDDFLSKPLSVDELYAILSKLTSGIEALAVSRVVPAPTVNGSGLNRAAILARLGQSTDLLQDIVRLFLDETPARLQQLRQHLGQNEFPQLARLAHTLRGSISTFGAEEVVALTRQVEQAANQGDRPVITAALDQLDRAVARLTPIVAALAEPVAAPIQA